MTAFTAIFFNRGDAVQRRQRGDGNIAGQVVSRKHGLDPFRRRRYQRQAVAPAAGKKQGVEVFKTVAPNIDDLGIGTRKVRRYAGRGFEERIHVAAVIALPGGIADGERRRPDRRRKEQPRRQENRKNGAHALSPLATVP